MDHNSLSSLRKSLFPTLYLTMYHYVTIYLPIGWQTMITQTYTSDMTIKWVISVCLCLWISLQNGCWYYVVGLLFKTLEFWWRWSLWNCVSFWVSNSIPGAVIPSNPSFPQSNQKDLISSKESVLSIKSAFGASSLFKKLNTVSLSCNENPISDNESLCIKWNREWWTTFMKSK